MLSTEREKEERAPKLSPRFLQNNMNADQRRIIVGYLIRLGVSVTKIANVINADIDERKLVNHATVMTMSIYRSIMIFVDDFQVHCNYASRIIYQTIKLFDVVIDRILVETDNIQLIALTCLWINLKREALYIEIPSVMKSFVSTDMLHGNIFSPIESIQEHQTVFPDEFALLFRRQRCCNWQRTYTLDRRNNCCCMKRRFSWALTLTYVLPIPSHCFFITYGARMNMIKERILIRTILSSSTFAVVIWYVNDICTQVVHVVIQFLQQ